MSALFQNLSLRFWEVLATLRTGSWGERMPFLETLEFFACLCMDSQKESAWPASLLCCKYKAVSKVNLWEGGNKV